MLDEEGEEQERSP